MGDGGGGALPAYVQLMHVAFTRFTIITAAVRIFVLLAIVFARPAFAESTGAGMQVSATVVHGCAVSTASAALSVRCSEDAPERIAIDGGLLGGRHVSGALQYELAADPTRTDVWIVTIHF